MGAGRLRPTARGVGVGLAAAALVLAGLTLGRREAVAIGVFLAALWLLSLAALAAHARLAGRDRLAREASPPEVVAGGSARVTFSGVLPGLRDAVPGGAPVPVPAAGYWWPAPRRGEFDLGPARTHLSAPFGLWTGSAPVTGTSRVRVLPAPLDHPALDAVLRPGAGGLEAADPLGSEAAPDDLLVREHRDGDPLARIHWGATARTGRLMVRQEEWAPEPWTAVVLDCRAVSFPDGRHRVDGGAGRTWMTAPAFERAVGLAAELVQRLEFSGHRVLLLDQDGHRLDPGLADAALEPVSREAAWPDALPSQAVSVVAVLGAAAARDLPVLRGVPAGVHRAALLLGPPPDGHVGRTAHAGRRVQATAGGTTGTAVGASGPAAAVPGQTAGGVAAALEADGWVVVGVPE
ncbi:MAG TPA: DUF58 domain-containing protein [Citricoccus sp.]